MKYKQILAAKIVSLWIALTLVIPTLAAPVAFSAAGASPASILATVNAFRTALGVLNPNVGGQLNVGGGRREINWDGGGSTATALAGTPFNGFLATRGTLFTTPGTGFVQAPVAGLVTTFSNAGYSTIFQSFSPVRLFSAIGSNITDVLFFVPDSNIPATVNGFGAVFADVDLPDSTSLEFFDTQGMSLGLFFAPPANNGVSFVGVMFDAGERVSRVRITSGNTAPGPAAADGGAIDVVMMDDFIFGEPQALPPPPGGPFMCIQDESGGTVLTIDTSTGAFQFTSCGVLTFGGTGTLKTRGCNLNLKANVGGRRVQATIDTCAGKGTATIQDLSLGRKFSVSDRNTDDNTCACP
jgi:hypothetical protein